MVRGGGPAPLTFPYKEGAQKLHIFLKAQAALNEFMLLCGPQRKWRNSSDEKFKSFGHNNLTNVSRND